VRQRTKYALQRSSPPAWLDDASESAAARAQSRSLPALEKKHFSYCWSPDTWDPTTAGRIHEWGETLYELIQCVTLPRKATPRSRVVGCIEALLSLQRADGETWRLALQATLGDRAWGWVVHDIYSQAGSRSTGLETVALDLIKRRWIDLARTVLEIEAYLRPEHSGPSRAHVMAASGQRKAGIAELRRIVKSSLNPCVREHAQACLKDLRSR
jgi:hypothetical protein